MINQISNTQKYLLPFNELWMIVEIPKGSIYKYEYSSVFNSLVLNREMKVPYPFNYGFIPGTLADDGDELDVLVLTREPIVPMTAVLVDPICALKVVDKGKIDYKIVANIKHKEPNIYDSRVQQMIVDFFSTYKLHEESQPVIEGWLEKKETLKIIQNAWKESKEYES